MSIGISEIKHKAQEQAEIDRLKEEYFARGGKIQKHETTENNWIGKNFWKHHGEVTYRHQQAKREAELSRPHKRG